MELAIIETNGVQTMSSLEMVEFINATRKPGKAVLRHDHFMVKVPAVLGGIEAPKFLGTQKYGNNISRAVYNFPRREAMLMAMSYSYELQAAVFDAWEKAEAKLKQTSVAAIPNFSNPAEAARAWALEYEAKEAAQKALAVASVALVEAQPKVEFHDAVVADNSVHSLGDAAKLLGTGRTKLCAFLRTRKYVQMNLVPYQASVDNGWLESSFHQHTKHDGTLAAPTTFVTGKGLAYFQKKLALPENHLYMPRKKKVS